MTEYKSIFDNRLNGTFISESFPDSDFHRLPYLLIDSFSNFGIIKVSEEYVSTIEKERPINIVVSHKDVDCFLCTFFVNKIVLTEKKRNDRRFLELTKKKYWSFTECSIVNNLEELHYSFDNIKVNIIQMNSQKEFIVPIIKR